MKIAFSAPIYPVTPDALHAFLKILNLLVLSAHIVDFNKKLIHGDAIPVRGNLSGHFAWNFHEDRFSLWQRTGYGSRTCFEHKILEIACIDLADRGDAGFYFSMN